MTKADEMRKMAAQNKKTKTEKVDDYEETLNIKQQKVQNLINKTLTKKVEVEKTLGMGNPYNYRNKAQYPVGTNKNGEKVFGVFAKRTHEIIPIKECKIQNQKKDSGRKR